MRNMVKTLVPEKPELIREAEETGDSIYYKIWKMMSLNLVSCEKIPAPLGIGKMKLNNGIRNIRR